MKLSFVLCAVTSFLGAANAVAFANAAPAAQPEVIDISEMKLRLRGTSPPPPSPSKREYEEGDVEENSE
ncbi:hypothetical protein N7471_013679 [Penicillium samsonianum]|uniref:uncharacterized protein n=1 Tax=Penicillium samsonianum TaxID=1882272 RepID=UPI002549A8B3|nr:uncharacterized protein N7471_013679 [Penicillium samsonianum]KAJ6118212.1 hypothetical protein N7471_013679 [Penicillium samsonianum]